MTERDAMQTDGLTGVFRLAVLLGRSRKLLERLEWDATLEDGPGCYTTGCPACGGSAHAKAHADDCELAALLREIPQ